MDKKDWIKKAIECRSDETRKKPNVECLICPYGRDLDFSEGDDIASTECNLAKLKEDIAEMIGKSK